MIINPLFIWDACGLFDDDDYYDYDDYDDDYDDKDDDYDDKDDDDKDEKSEKIKDRMFSWGFWTFFVIMSFALIYAVTPRGIAATHGIKAKKKARNEILESAHSYAVNSANTVNLADYEIISKSQAKRDSAYYAREVSHFIHIGGDQYLNYELTREKYGRQSVESYIDKRRLCGNPEFQKYLEGYTHSVEQLAVQRRISNQK